MKWYLKAIKNYFNFGGRARRREYWMFTLVNFIINFVILAVEEMAGIPGALTVIYSLFIFFPGLALAIRRLHDTGRSGWWILLSLIPLVGAIILLVFFCEDSETGTNEYGSNPKLDF